MPETLSESMPLPFEIDDIQSAGISILHRLDLQLSSGPTRSTESKKETRETLIRRR